MRRALAAAWVVLAACSGGATDGRDAGPRVRGTAEVGGQIVSTVDGQPIDLETVAHATRAAGVEPTLALRRLQDEQLLAAAAERAGFGEDPEVERAGRRAAVQALLARTVEVEATEADLDRAAIEAAYETAPQRYDRPERRRSVHAVARVQGDDAATEESARSWARALLEEVRAAPDPEAAVLAVRRRSVQGLGFEVLVEDLAPLANTDGADPAFIEAVFELDEAGLVPRVVRTAVGWHVVVVTAIEPAARPSRDEALARLTREALAAQRARRLEQLLAELARGAGVTLVPAGVDRVMNDPRLLGGEE